MTTLQSTLFLPAKVRWAPKVWDSGTENERISITFSISPEIYNALDNIRSKIATLASIADTPENIRQNADQLQFNFKLSHKCSIFSPSNTLISSKPLDLLDNITYGENTVLLIKPTLMLRDRKHSLFIKLMQLYKLSDSPDPTQTPDKTPIDYSQPIEIPL